MICAAIIEIIDLGIDRVLLGLADSGYIVVYKCVSVAEFFFRLNVNNSGWVFTRSIFRFNRD